MWIIEKKVLSPVLKTHPDLAGLRHSSSFQQHTRDECDVSSYLDAAVTPAELIGYLFTALQVSVGFIPNLDRIKICSKFLNCPATTH